MMDKNKQAILLLSSYFTSPVKCEPIPLTPLEYGRFALWLKENDLKPGDLLVKFDEVVTKWKDIKNKITRERLSFLIGRGMAMGMALEKWHSAGIWCITRSDTDYPQKMKMHLGDNAPVLLFGVGNKALLSSGGLSIVGSRNIDSDDQDFTTKIAKQAAIEGLNIVSGGARGVDESAMLASLEADGTATGILSDNLFKAALSSKWRKYLRRNQLVLASTYYPEASFNIGNAMGRNKYIYCLSDYALVVRTDKEKGGTWAGAKENLRNNWIPLFIKEYSNSAGNLALIEMGAKSFQEQTDNSNDWLLNKLNSKDKADNLEKISEAKLNACKHKITDKKERSNTIPEYQAVEEEIKSALEGKIEYKNEELKYSEIQMQGLNFDDDDIFYRYFIKYLKHLLERQSIITLAELKSKRKDLVQKQIVDWLERATDECVLVRQGHKHKYSLKNTKLLSKMND